MTDSGFCQLPRHIIDFGVLTDINALRVYLHFLSNAATKPHVRLSSGRSAALKKGDSIFAFRKLGEFLGISLQEVRTSVNTLSDAGLIVYGPHKSRRFSIASIVNHEALGVADQGWVMLPKSALVDKKLVDRPHAQAALVYLSIKANYQDQFIGDRVVSEVGEVSVNHYVLAEMLNISDCEAELAISQLVEFGYLQFEKTKHKKTFFVKFLRVVSIQKNLHTRNTHPTHPQHTSNTHPTQDKKARKQESKKAINSIPQGGVYDFSWWDNPPDPEVFKSYCSMYRLKKNFDVSQAHVKQLAGNFKKMKKIFWTVDQCLLRMVEENWTSIDPSYRGICRPAGVNNDVSDDGESWLDKHTDRSWAEGL